jgi:hypothetical protein
MRLFTGRYISLCISPYMGRLFCVLMLACASIASQPADASEQYQVRYLVQWGNFNLGISEALWQFDDTSVTMRGTSRPKGAFSGFADYEGMVELAARKTDTGWQTEMLNISSREDDEIRTATSRWSEYGRQVSTTRSPDIDLEIYFPLTDEMLAGVTAPFTAMLDMLDRLEAGQPCEGTFEIYDGWRRASLSFADLGTTILEADRPFGYSGEAQICGIISKPVGGHRRVSRFRKQNPEFEDIKAYIAAPSGSRLMPVRIEIDLPIGSLIVRLDTGR